MKGLKFKLDKEYCKEHGFSSSLGYDTIEIIDCKISRVTHHIKLNNFMMEIYEYEYACIGDDEFFFMNEDEFREDLSDGIYKLMKTGAIPLRTAGEI